MLSKWLSPVTGSCCAPNSKNCISSIAANAASAEILDEDHPCAPSSLEVLIEDGLLPRATLPAGPSGRLAPMYTTSEQKLLGGDPLFSGNILQLLLGESMHEVVLTIHANGFSIVPCEKFNSARSIIRAVSRSWSPFSLIEKCQVKTTQHAESWAVLKVTIFRAESPDLFYYFATTGKDAFKERDLWVTRMAEAIRNVTASLFPPRGITVEPMPGVAATSTRIMAGYLLRCNAEDLVSLVYCELHAHSGGEAHFVVYRDEWCEHEVVNILLAETSVVSTRKGCYCTLFGVDEHRFCARTQEEKDLWLRAVSNIKVKLMFDAPDPTDQDLAVFRAAVHERIEPLNLPVSQEEPNPLLQAVPRTPLPLHPRGDVLPEPIEDMPGPNNPNFGRQNTSTLSGDAGTSACEVELSALQPTQCKNLVNSLSTDLVDTCKQVAAEMPGSIKCTSRKTDKDMVAAREAREPAQPTLEAAAFALQELRSIDNVHPDPDSMCQPACMPSPVTMFSDECKRKTAPTLTWSLLSNNDKQSPVL